MIRPGSPPAPPDESPNAQRFAQQHAVELGVPSLVWGRGQARRVRIITESISLTNRRILDVGCGIGQYVRHLRDLPATVVGIDVERTRVRQGAASVPGLMVATAERLPFAAASFDVVLLNEVIEHVGNDRQALEEALRVVPVGGHVVIYAPNRWFPFETHGIYWRGRYHFGNYPLVNYLPDGLRNRLVPHARAYSRSDIRHLLRGLPARVLVHSAVYPGFDGMRVRSPQVGGALQATLHRAERTPLRWLGLSHFVILEKRKPLGRTA